MKNNFKELIVWRKGIELTKLVYKYSVSFPNHEKFSFTSQILRASVSIPSNIAEGAGRSSEKEFSRFLHIDRGSSYELETLLILAKELNYIQESIFMEINSLNDEIQKMLHKLLINLKNKSRLESK